MTIGKFSAIQFLLGTLAGATGLGMCITDHFFGMLIIGGICAAISVWLDNKYERENA